MYGKRGGRVSVNKIQFMDLVQRVEKLEAEIEKLTGESQGEEPDATGLKKPEIIEMLKERGIDFNPRDKKEVLMSLLED